MLRGRFRSRIRLDIETDDDRIGCACEVDVGLVDVADGGMYDLDRDFLVGKFAEALLDSFHGALHVCLDNDRKFLDVACLDLVKEVVKIHLLLGLFKLVLLLLRNEGLRNASCFLLVVAYHEYLAGIRNVIQAQDLSRDGRAGLADPVALVVKHRTDLAVAGASSDIVTDFKSTLLYQDGRHGAASLIELCLNDKASRITVRVRFELKDVCHQQDHVEQIADAFARLGRDRAHRRGAAPFLCDQSVLCQLLLYHVRIGGRLIHLVDGYDDFNACGFCMVDRLDRLRLDAVIRRDNKDCDIRRLCAS